MGLKQSIRARLPARSPRQGPKQPITAPPRRTCGSASCALIGCAADTARRTAPIAGEENGVGTAEMGGGGHGGTVCRGLNDHCPSVPPGAPLPRAGQTPLCHRPCAAGRRRRFHSSRCWSSQQPVVSFCLLRPSAQTSIRDWGAGDALTWAAGHPPIYVHPVPQGGAAAAAHRHPSHRHTVTLSHRHVVTRPCLPSEAAVGERHTSGKTAEDLPCVTGTADYGCGCKLYALQQPKPTQALCRAAPGTAPPGERAEPPLGLQLRETAAVGAAVPMAAHAPRADILGTGWVQTFFFHRRPCPTPRCGGVRARAPLWQCRQSCPAA